MTRAAAAARPSRRAQGTPALDLKRAGVVEWFRLGEYERVEQTLGDLNRLGIQRLRTAVSWADYHTEEGVAWYDWLLPYLAQRVDLLPCFLYTPPSLGIIAKTSSPPRDAKWYADFVDVIVERHGRCFEWVELWNEPNNLNDWDWHYDYEWQLFARMVGGAAYWLQRLGKKTVLGGMCPADSNWLALMCERGVIAHIDVVGIHAFPGTWQPHWQGWQPVVDALREVLDGHRLAPAIWITETGYSTWAHHEIGQVSTFVAALQSEADRVYWYSYRDLPGNLEGQEGFHFDERHYHTGLVTAAGRPKLLHRALASEGLKKLEQIDRIAHAPQIMKKTPQVVVTGGAGFVGANLVDRLASDGQHVLVFDALARDHVEENVDWLTRRHPRVVGVEVGDIRDAHGVRALVDRACKVYHLAAQVAVTCSLDDPVADFEINARGTLNVLEAIRAQASPPPLVFTSTNKVYGAACSLGDLDEEEHRYRPRMGWLAEGFSEDQPLDLHSPYGCSKGAGDQYVLDYARIFGIPAVVFRMSCIYGPRQFGNEDQGWVAHFLRAALLGQPITIYGNGKQVRDLLFVDDLVDALLMAQHSMQALRGRAFNIGGGPPNTASLLEILAVVERVLGPGAAVSFAGPRPGDQPYYVSNIGAFAAATGWRPRMGVEEGVHRLMQWLCDWTGRELPTPAVEVVRQCASL